MIREYPILPVPKPRMTQRDKWTKRDCVIRYLAFKDECKLRKVVLSVSGAHVTFILPMPESWSKKMKTFMDGKPHQLRPDRDNLEKALLDALYKNDAIVWDCHTTKRWGRKGKIIIEVP